MCFWDFERFETAKGAAKNHHSVNYAYGSCELRAHRSIFQNVFDSRVTFDKHVIIIELDHVLLCISGT